MYYPRLEVTPKRSTAKGWQSRSILSALLVSLMIGGVACSKDEYETKGEKGAPPKFSETNSLQKLDGNTAYNLDYINGSAFTETGPVVVNSAEVPTINIVGWAVDAHAQAPAGGVYFIVDGKSELKSTFGADRDDVAVVYKEPNYKKSGFEITIPTSSLEKGRHTLSIRILSADKKAYYDPERKYDIDVQ